MQNAESIKLSVVVKIHPFSFIYQGFAIYKSLHLRVEGINMHFPTSSPKFNYTKSTFLRHKVIWRKLLHYLYNYMPQC